MVIICLGYLLFKDTGELSSRGLLEILADHHNQSFAFNAMHAQQTYVSSYTLLNNKTKSCVRDGSTLVFCLYLI